MKRKRTVGLEEPRKRKKRRKMNSSEIRKTKEKEIRDSNLLVGRIDIKYINLKVINENKSQFHNLWTYNHIDILNTDNYIDRNIRNGTENIMTENEYDNNDYDEREELDLDLIHTEDFEENQEEQEEDETKMHELKSPLVELIQENYRDNEKREDNYVLEIELLLTHLSDELTNLTKPLAILRDFIIYKDEKLTDNQFDKLCKIYDDWNYFFFQQYNDGIDLARSDHNISNDSISVHLYIEISRLHQILMKCNKIGNNNDINQRPIFWYIPRDGLLLSQIERTQLSNLPTIESCCCYDLKHLPKSIILFPKVVILKMTLKQMYDSLLFLLQNTQIDFHMMVNCKARIQIFYFIELLFTRCDMLINEDELDKSVFIGREEYRIPSNKGNGKYMVHFLFIKMLSHLRHLILVHFYTSSFFSKYLLFIPLKGKECLDKRNCRLIEHDRRNLHDNDDDNDNDDVNMDYNNSNNNSQDYEWDAKKNIFDIQTFFSKFMKNRISNNYEIFSNFFEKMITNISFFGFLAGLQEYDRIIDINTRDFWIKYSKINRDTVREKLETYLPDSSQFINLYTIKINELLGGPLEKNSKQTFEIYITPFLKGYFFQLVDFKVVFLKQDMMEKKVFQKFFFQKKKGKNF